MPFQPFQDLVLSEQHVPGGLLFSGNRDARPMHFASGASGHRVSLHIL